MAWVARWGWSVDAGGAGCVGWVFLCVCWYVLRRLARGVGVVDVNFRARRSLRSRACACWSVFIAILRMNVRWCLEGNEGW